MSAYGDISRPTRITNPGVLRARSYLLPRCSNHSVTQKSLTVLPLDAQRTTGQEHILEPVLLYLSRMFDAIIEEGRTYPQETKLGFEGFKKYFLSHDFFVGIIDTNSPHSSVAHDGDNGQVEEGIEHEDTLTLSDMIADRELSSCLVGMFYIKPNYPGRSSHCCNGGFVVDPHHRAQKIGKTLARSYLHYAPRLGYRASVFNLVYTNNLASIAIWDSLGFERVGLIPEAGRLKLARSSEAHDKADAQEWVDAIIYWKKFHE